MVLPILAGAIGAGGAALYMASAEPVNTTDRAAIEKIVREYILTHPEILPQAMENLRAQELTKVVVQNRAAIETPVGDAWEGAADADVTLVEFFDYACGYCRASIADIDRLLAEDKKLKVVYRDMPVLGEDSVEAARLSVAAAMAGKFNTMHKPLYAKGRPTPDALAAVRKEIGLDRAAIANPAVDQELTKNLQLQRQLDLSGTPAWVVGNKVLVGAVGYDALKAAIAEARAAKASR
ncbi:DsbA family protein [Chakrabartia godavariana]|nr:DsbA family protein [Chakrabartia godavariana]